MKIELIAENKKEEKLLGFKKMGWKDVSEFYVDVTHGKIPQQDNRSLSGDGCGMIGRLQAGIERIRMSMLSNGSSK